MEEAHKQNPPAPAPEQPQKKVAGKGKSGGNGGKSADPMSS